MPTFTDQYFINITEVSFVQFHQPSENGVCISISLEQSVSFISHCIMANNDYYDGALYSDNATSIFLKFICFFKNRGNKGSHFCSHVDAMFVNYTHEVADHQCHGSMACGLQISHFNFNNITNSKVEIFSPWHFLHNHKSSITKYCQTSNTISSSISSSNMPGSGYDLQYFNYINCSAETLNNYAINKGQLTYSECVFLLSNQVNIGHPCTFKNCYSNGTVISSNVVTTTGIHQLVFPNPVLCMHHRMNIEERGTLHSKSLVIISFLLFLCVDKILLHTS